MIRNLLFFSYFKFNPNNSLCIVLKLYDFIAGKRILFVIKQVIGNIQYKSVIGCIFEVSHYHPLI